MNVVVNIRIFSAYTFFFLNNIGRFSSCWSALSVLLAILVLVGWCFLVLMLVADFDYLLSVALAICDLVGWCFWCWVSRGSNGKHATVP